MLDIISVGSCTVDVFIDPEKKRFIKHLSHKDIAFCIGSKYLIKNLNFSTGGGGTNSAVSFSRLGLKAGWIGVLGKDHNSELVKKELLKEKVKILGPAKNGQIGYSIILSKLKKDRTIITYKGINDSLLLKDIHGLNTKWLYISSMMGKSFDTIKKIVKFAKKKKIRWVFNPSAYLAKQGIGKLGPIMKDAEILVLNKEEAQLLVKKKKSTDKLLKILQKYSRIVAITDGRKGAVAYDGVKFYSSRPKNVKVVETTGAGDAFASGFVAGIIKGRDINEALQIGQLQAESVLQAVGAKNNLLRWNELIKRLK